MGPSHRDRGSMRRSSSQGTSSQITERERTGTAAGTPAELDPAACPRHLWNLTAAAETQRAAKGTRPRRQGNSTAPPHPERKAKRRICIGARRGRRSASGQPPLRKAKWRVSMSSSPSSLFSAPVLTLLPLICASAALDCTAMAFGSGFGKRWRSEDDEDIHAEGEDIDASEEGIIALDDEEEEPGSSS